ncbi:uncharacterized protein EI97DRAFT_455747 [Westerdykella ornata]|uniref:Rhodopsin domain-containing protein n=1 Tax=Westerdykella ornata TaxID=318751 RepID=A0A6A6JTE7_WESOR|nr:uncharacterized protein EI97DRAFT_455747 [Westerdykella ornata]KAF2279514.1 hypothetical protein EI97DRAFT_455747 [Westerdykella ornata]
MTSSPPGVSAALWNLPALPPPPGKHSNFDNPENRNDEIIIINAVFLTLMTAAVLMRFIIRRRGENRVGWDGLMCIVAVMGSVAHSVLEISNLKVGYGRHMWDIRGVTLTRESLLRMNQISTTYIIAVGFAKLSVLILYLRSFEVIRLTRILIWTAIVFNIAFSLAFLGVVIAQAVECMGLEALSNKFWTNTSKVTTAQAGVNVFLDFYILFIPLQQVYNLNIDRTRKLGVAAVFGVGSL